MANMKTSMAQLILTLLLAGFAVWLFTTLGGVAAQVKCIVDGIDSLGAMDTSTAAGTIANNAASQIPTAIMDTVKQAVPLLTVLAIIPAVFIAIFAMIIAFCVMKKKAEQGACCTKFLMFIFMFFCFLGIVFYFIIGISGIAAGTQQGKDQLDQLMAPCRVQIPEMALELTTAQAQFDANELQLTAILAANGDDTTARADVETARNELSAAQTVSTTLTNMCDCLQGIMDELGKLSAPGLLCAAVCILLFLINCCQCCMLCCAKKGKVASVDSSSGPMPAA
jgi:hypothetical protein